MRRDNASCLSSACGTSRDPDQDEDKHEALSLRILSQQSQYVLQDEDKHEALSLRTNRSRLSSNNFGVVTGHEIAHLHGIWHTLGCHQFAQFLEVVNVLRWGEGVEETCRDGTWIGEGM